MEVVISEERVPGEKPLKTKKRTNNQLRNPLTCVVSTPFTVISPRLLSPLFSSHLAHFKCNISRSISHIAKQVRIKCNIPHCLSHKPKRAGLRCNISRSQIGG